MKSNILKYEAKKYRGEGNAYKEISSKLNILLFSARKCAHMNLRRLQKWVINQKFLQRLNCE